MSSARPISFTTGDRRGVVAALPSLADRLADRASRADACETAIAANAALNPGVRLVVHEPLPLTPAAAFVLDIILRGPSAPHDLEGAVGAALNVDTSTGRLGEHAADRTLRFARDVAAVTVADLLALSPLDTLVDLLFDARLRPALRRAS